MEERTQANDGIEYDEIAPRDVKGFHVFDPETGRGLGEVVGIKRVSGEAQFVCDSHGDLVNRRVDRVMNRLREQSYELCTEPWDVADPEVVEKSGSVAEAEIRDRAFESWSRLADEYGLTEGEVREIIADGT